MGAIPGGAARTLVDDAEDVCRLCFKAGIPITVDKAYPDEIEPDTQMIRAVQISKQDLLQRGFSLQRKGLYSQQLARAEPSRRERARRKEGKPRAGFKLHGLLSAPVGQIHQIVDSEGVRVFNVYATPNRMSVAHAEILMDPVRFKGSAYLKWRLELREALGTIQPVTVLPSVPWGVWERFAAPILASAKRGWRRLAATAVGTEETEN